MKKRWLSIILSCVMLLQLLPIVTLATETSSSQQIEVGQHVALGKKDGRDLTWEILAIENGKALLFSNYVMDFVTVSKRKSANFSYCDSELNEWCENFLDISFSESEKEAICNILFLNKTECAQYVKSKRLLWPGLSGEMGAIGLGLVQATDNNCNIWLSSCQNGRWVDTFGWYDGELSFGTSANLTNYSGIYGACPAIALELDKVEFIGNGTFESPYTLRYGAGGTGDSTESGPVEITSFHPVNGQENVDSGSLKIQFDRDVSNEIRSDRPDLDFSKEPLSVYRAEDDELVYQVEESSTKPGTSVDMLVRSYSMDTVSCDTIMFDPETTYYVTMGEGFIKMADGTVSPEIKKGDWKFTTAKASDSVETSVKVGTGFGGNNPVIDGVKWKDAWFESPSTKYNHELAETSMVLSAAAYVGSENMKTTWKDLGFDSKSIETHYPAEATKDNNDFVAYSFAAKKLSGEQKGTTFIAIAVRGTPGSAEWYSNFNIGQYTQFHSGFTTAAYSLREDFDKYLDELKKAGYQIDETTKFLVTGHSRGAAVANIIAMSLTAHQYSEQTNIYGYTFATPTVSVEASKNGYENIFNIVNKEDFVTHVPMEAWGFGRYGVDLQLPSRSYYSSGSFDTVQGKMINEFLAITNREMFHAYSGTHAVNNLVKYILKVAPSRDAFYEQENKFMVLVKKTPYEYFSILADFLANQSSAQTYNELIGSLQAHMDYSSITGYFVTQEASNILHYTLGGKVTDSHCPALYLSWMRSCTDKELFGPNNGESYTEYKRATIACPVDVYVYNEAGTLVASVVNEEVVVDTLAVSVQDGVKTIDLPADQEYRVEIKAREGGTVDYTVEEKSVDSAIDTTRAVLFNDITIVKGDKLLGEITTKPETQTYSLTKNDNQVIQADYDLDSEGIPAIMFVAAYEDNGRMIGCYAEEITFMGPNAEYGITKTYGDATYKVFFLDQNQKPLCGEKVIEK